MWAPVLIKYSSCYCYCWLSQFFKKMGYRGKACSICRMHECRNCSLCGKFHCELCYVSEKSPALYHPKPQCVLRKEIIQKMREQGERERKIEDEKLMKEKRKQDGLACFKCETNLVGWFASSKVQCLYCKCWFCDTCNDVHQPMEKKKIEKELQQQRKIRAEVEEMDKVAKIKEAQRKSVDGEIEYLRGEVEELSRVAKMKEAQKKSMDDEIKGLRGTVEDLKERKRHVQDQVPLFRECVSGLYMTSTVTRTRLWIIGETGTGKTTTIGKLCFNDKMTGRSGLLHDTVDISEHHVSMFNDSTLSNYVLMDTRGAGDGATYSCSDLYFDLSMKYCSSDMSKILLLFDGSKRLSSTTVRLLRDVHQAFPGNFVVVMTHTTRAQFKGQVGNGEPSRWETFQKQALQKGVRLKEEDVLHVDWSCEEESSQLRSKLFQRLAEMNEVNINFLNGKCLWASILDSVDNEIFKKFQKRLMDYIVPCLLFLISKTPRDLLVIAFVACFAVKFLVNNSGSIREWRAKLFTIHKSIK